MVEKMKKIKFEYVRIVIYVISIILTILTIVGKINLLCYWKENYGILCPACGLTRATISIMQFKFQKAFELNAFYTIVLIPFVLILVLNDLYVIIKRHITKKKDISLVEIMLGEGKNG